MEHSLSKRRRLLALVVAWLGAAVLLVTVVAIVSARGEQGQDLTAPTMGSIPELPSHPSVATRAYLPIVSGVPQPVDLVVTNTNDGGPGSLRQAIADAQPGDAVGFDLTYPATITLFSGELVITKSLSIRGPGPDLLAVSGNGNSRVFRVEAVGLVAKVAPQPHVDQTMRVAISGLTMRDGAAGLGGGVWSNVDMSLVNAVLRDNKAQSEGGGMWNDRANPVLAHVSFLENSADSAGGMYNDGGSPRLADVTFTGNQATSSGGGMISSGGDPTLTGVVFASNKADQAYGGGMRILAGSPVLIGVVFRTNFARWLGGGLANHGGNPRLTDVEFINNSTDEYGGGMHDSGGVVLTNGRFHGNAADQGGGIYIDDMSSTVLLANTVFSRNSAGKDGGGLYNDGSNVTLANVTVYGNWAGRGGGIYSAGGSPAIQNSILWGNLDDSGGDQIFSTSASTPTITYCDIQGSGGSGAGWDASMGTDLGGNLDADPRFVSSAWVANLRLTWGSPALDAGDSGLVPDGVTTDLDGAPRIANGRVDMGAYEFQPRLLLAKTASQPWASPGERFTYTLQVSNLFTDTVMSGAVVSDALPPGLELAGPVRLDPPGDGTVGAPPILVQDLTLSPVQVAAIQVPVLVDAATPLGMLANRATVTSTQVPTAQLASHLLWVCGSQITVTSDADSGPGSLRQAIVDVCPGGSIDFALDTPATITLSGGELLVDKPLTIAGPGLDLLAVSGNGNSRVFRVDGPDSGEVGGHGRIEVTLSGMTIRDGDADKGGGLWNDEDLILRDVRLVSNQAEHGGGMYNVSGDPTLSDVTFLANKATDIWSTCGGGLENVEGNPWLTDVIFDSNLAPYGGGMYNASGSPALTNVVFLRNGGSNPFGPGGYGLLNLYGSPVLVNVAFRGNSGRGMGSQGGQPSLLNTLFAGNGTGGLSVTDGSPVLTNVTITGNRAGKGGGLSLYSSTAIIQNTIIWGNSASTAGDQVYTEASTTTIRFSDIQGSSGSGPGWDAGLGIDGGGNLDADPRFVAPVAPGTAPTTIGDLRLQAGPAVDAGDKALLPAGATTDLAGVPRIVNGQVDLGAYELQGGLYLVKDAGQTWASPGQRLTYTLKALNTSPDLAMSDGVISDTLPAGLLLAGPIGLEPPGAGLVGQALPVLVCDLAIPPGQAVTVTLPVTVGRGVTLGTTITNRATLTTSQVTEPRSSSHELLVCASRITVSSQADAGQGTLRQAIADLCPAGGTISFDLTYPATITLTSGELDITKSMAIAGPGPALLTISGDGRRRVFDVDAPRGANQIRVSISGLTVRDGYGRFTGGGGGVWNDEILTLTDMVLRDNQGGDGGGLLNAGGRLALSGVNFEGNSGSYGGGLYSEIGEGTCDLNLKEVHFSRNQAFHGGGGMYHDGKNDNGVGTRCNPTLAGLSFELNSADSGGGIYSQDSNPVLIGARFHGNSASEDGGGMYNSASDPLLINATFSGNAAHNGGGAIYNEESHPTLTNVAFDANSAGSGGGIYNYESKPRIQNSILWDNRASASPQILNTSASTPTITYCDVQGSGGSGAGWDTALGVDGGGNLDADPLFVAPVLPVGAAGASGDAVPRAAAWDLRLRAGSPAIDAGDNGLLPPGVITDLGGRPRIVNDTVDLGAYEFGFGIYLPVSMRTAAP